MIFLDVLSYSCANPQTRLSKSLKDDLIQSKAFTVWINNTLKPIEKSITEIQALGDGDIIVHLVEVHIIYWHIAYYLPN